MVARRVRPWTAAATRGAVRPTRSAIPSAARPSRRDPQPKKGTRPTPKGRRDLSASNLPRVVVEILDEEHEASGVRRIGFEDSLQLMFKRGGFSVLVKRVAK